MRFQDSPTSASPGSDFFSDKDSDESGGDDIASSRVLLRRIRILSAPLTAALLVPLLFMGVALQLQPSRGPARAASSAKVIPPRSLARPDLSLATRQGTVEAIYTFGAPATANPPLASNRSGDRCLGGLRSYNVDILGPYTKQVDAASVSNPYHHAQMPALVLRSDSASDYVPCPGGPTEPNDHSGGVFAEWELHWASAYLPRFKHVALSKTSIQSEEVVAMAYKFAHLAWLPYENTSQARMAIDEKLPGWRLVARETRVQGDGTFYDEDPVLLVQETTSLDCALVLTGTNNDNELTTSTTSFSTGYCGFDHVHAGYRNELWSIAKDLWPSLRPKLASCRQVSCVGHSMGGSLCEILAACADSDRDEDPDYVNQQWYSGVPQLMEEVNVGGVVLINGARLLCDEPPCTIVS